jgi:hypothetical protein
MQNKTHEQHTLLETAMFIFIRIPRSYYIWENTGWYSTINNLFCIFISYSFIPFLYNFHTFIHFPYLQGIPFPSLSASKSQVLLKPA